MKKVKIWLGIIALMSFFVGCGAPAEQPTGNSLQPTPAASPQAVPRSIPERFKVTLTGKLGGRYDVQMDLERQGDEIKGSYFYERAGAARISEKYITLSGKIDVGGNVQLTEEAYTTDMSKPRKTGEFQGKLTPVRIDGEEILQFSGNWTRARDKQTLPFSLEQRRLSLGGYKLSNSERKEENKSPRYELTTNLPQLTGGDPAQVARFNQLVVDATAADVSEFKRDSAEMKQAGQRADEKEDAPGHTLEIDHSVVSSTPEYVSILLTTFSYLGGAHPNTKTVAINWDLRRGSKLELADLFTPGANYLPLLSDYCRRELKKLKVGDDEWIDRGAGPALENYKSWNITPQGLMITFDAYQVASYAEGPQEVIVPYSILRAVINPQGALRGYRQ